MQYNAFIHLVAALLAAVTAPSSLSIYLESMRYPLRTSPCAAIAILSLSKVVASTGSDGIPEEREDGKAYDGVCARARRRIHPCLSTGTWESYVVWSLSWQVAVSRARGSIRYFAGNVPTYLLLDSSAVPRY